MVEEVNMIMLMLGFILLSITSFFYILRIFVCSSLPCKSFHCTLNFKEEVHVWRAGVLYSDQARAFFFFINFPHRPFIVFSSIISHQIFKSLKTLFLILFLQFFSPLINFNFSGRFFSLFEIIFRFKIYSFY